MKKDIKNLTEIVELCKEELDNNDENVTAILDLTDLLSLRNLLKAYKELEETNKKQQAEIEDLRKQKIEYQPSITITNSELLKGK